jgi:hypothetical protein
MLRRFTLLDEHLAVGSHPHSPEHIMTLARDEGITGLLSLQTDDDIARRGLSWAMLWQLYLRAGITPVRIPIVDMDKRDLGKHLDSAVAALAGAIDSGQRVYVHCTAGLNRSPTVIIAYLVAHRSMSMDDANEWVQSRHECVPYPDVLKAWAKKRP